MASMMERREVVNFMILVKSSERIDRVGKRWGSFRHVVAPYIRSEGDRHGPEASGSRANANALEVSLCSTPEQKKLRYFCYVPRTLILP